jgi:hypothetical protein
VERARKLVRTTVSRGLYRSATADSCGKRGHTKKDCFAPGGGQGNLTREERSAVLDQKRKQREERWQKDAGATSFGKDSGTDQGGETGGRRIEWWSLGQAQLCPLNDKLQNYHKSSESSLRRGEGGPLGGGFFFNREKEAGLKKEKEREVRCSFLNPFAAATFLGGTWWW